MVGRARSRVVGAYLSVLIALELPSASHKLRGQVTSTLEQDALQLIRQACFDALGMGDEVLLHC